MPSYAAGTNSSYPTLPIGVSRVWAKPVPPQRQRRRRPQARLVLDRPILINSEARALPRRVSLWPKAILLSYGHRYLMGLPDVSRYNEAYRPGGYPMGYRFLPLSKGTTLLTQHFRLEF